jgi:hypothetical protein
MIEGWMPDWGGDDKVEKMTLTITLLDIKRVESVVGFAEQLYTLSHQGRGD